MPLTVLGSFYCFITSTLAESTLIPSVKTIKPKYFVQVTLNLDFLILA
jgi:hypothetical protein